MKKLLALLLAFLMPLCASAEAYRVSIQVDAGSDALLQAMKDALMAQGADAEAAEKEATLAQTLVDGFGVEVVFQESAFSLVLQLCGSQLFDLTVYETEEQTLSTSSMLPGYALSSPVEEAENLEQVEVDWAEAGMSVVPALEAWLKGLERSEAYGMFVGDAFAGGSKCTTWTLDDQDMAALVNSLLNEDVRAAMTAVYEAAGLEAEAILREFDHVNEHVAQENRYAYLLRVVQDSDEQLVGASLTVMQDGVQAATASLGFLSQGMRLVIGLGFEQQNYWCEIVSTNQETDAKKSMTVNVREWAASKEDAFAYVQGATAPANVCTWQLDLSENAWEGAYTANGNVLLTTTGTYGTAEEVLNGVVSFGTAETKLLSVSAVVSPADAIPELDEALVVCSTADPADAQLYEKLNAQLTAAVMARLLKLLPLELMMQLNQFTLP